MKTIPTPIATMIFFSMLLSYQGMGQRISFGLYASEGIVLAHGNVEELNFNNKQTLILAGNTVTISLTDNTAAVLTITGRADLDVTVTLDAPATLDLDTWQIPFACSFAYSNLGAANETIAKTQAVQVAPGFTSGTFQMLRRAAGPPGPPPTPDHAGQTLPTAVAYLFVYGTLGPVPQGAAAGQYGEQINVHVEYATYN